MIEPAAAGVRETLAAAAAGLAHASATPRLDAELLMAHALESTREAMLMTGLDRQPPASFGTLLARRIAGEPVAYIVGVRDFWTLTLAVTPAVLIPRADSETLIEAAIEALRDRPPRRILDLGTGSGALLLAALDHWRDATGLGTDASAAALAVAQANAAGLGLTGRTALARANWTDGLDELFDLVLCNPPYIADAAELPRDVADHEPRAALFAGPDGLACYRALAPALAAVMACYGVAVVEIGAGQAASAGAIFAAEGFAVATRRDLGGHERCLVLTMPPTT